MRQMLTRLAQVVRAHISLILTATGVLWFTYLGICKGLNLQGALSDALIKYAWMWIVVLLFALPELIQRWRKTGKD